jgi:hypothetical protein
MAAVIPILADESNVVFYVQLLVSELLTIFSSKIFFFFVLFISWYTQATEPVSISRTQATFLGFCVLLVYCIECFGISSNSHSPEIAY